VTARHKAGSRPAIGTAGLSPDDMRDGYCATLCFVAEDGSFVDIHLQPHHLEHLAHLLDDRGARFTMREEFILFSKRVK
jgi:hypothetical protein